mgnify:FL=1|jgi:hypothetical protein|tara:strand:+ start:798 stop:992 length:195 start_codon:yes stop_codon:yes gene_type:complete
MDDKFKCNPTGNCWCKKIPYKLEVSGDECLEPEVLINEIKNKYNLTRKEMERLMSIINEENKNI